MSAKVLTFPGVPCDACGAPSAIADMSQCYTCGERQCRKCWECSCDIVAREVVQRAGMFQPAEESL